MVVRGQEAVYVIRDDVTERNIVMSVNVGIQAAMIVHFEKPPKIYLLHNMTIGDMAEVASGEIFFEVLLHVMIIADLHGLNLD